MKKLDFGTISAGLDTLQNTLERNSGIGWSELVAADAIDFAEKNTYAADDTDETIRELADQIEVAGSDRGCRITVSPGGDQGGEPIQVVLGRKALSGHHHLSSLGKNPLSGF